MSVLNVRIVCTTPHNVPFIDASLWDLSGILSHLTAWQVHLRERELVNGAVYIIRTKPGWGASKMLESRLETLKWVRNIVLISGITKPFQKMKFLAIHAKSLEL